MIDHVSVTTLHRFALFLQLEGGRGTYISFRRSVPATLYSFSIKIRNCLSFLIYLVASSFASSKILRAFQAWKDQDKGKNIKHCIHYCMYRKWQCKNIINVMGERVRGGFMHCVVWLH